MGGKGEFDVSGGGGADPRDDYAHMADALPDDFPVFEDGAGEIEEIPNGLTFDAPLYYFQSSYVFNDFPGTDGFFGFSDDTTYNDRKDTKVELVEAGDFWVDFTLNRIYSYTNNSSDSYMHICERQLGFFATGPIAITEERVSVLGMMNDDITDETNSFQARTSPGNIVGIKGWWANVDPANVLGFFYTDQDTIDEVDHMGFYYSTDGGETFTQGTTTVDAWNNFTAYVSGDEVIHGGTWYRCNNGHTNQEPPNASYWNEIEAWTPDFWGVNRWSKHAAGVQIGNGIPGITNVFGERAGTLLTAANLGQGYAIHLSNKGNYVYVSDSSQKGSVWRRWNLKDKLSPNVTGEKFCAARNPRISHSDPVQAALASNNFYMFVLGNYHGGLGFSDGLQGPADFVEVTDAHIGESAGVNRVNDSVGDEAIAKMIATYDQPSNQIIIQGWHIGISGPDYNYVFSNSGGIAFTRYRWRDRFASETGGDDWWMEVCYSPDCKNCYATMRRSSAADPAEVWFWRSLDYGWTWQRIGRMQQTIEPTWQIHFHWFIILDEFYQVPAQKILAFANTNTTVQGGHKVWLLTEDGGATWTEVGRQSPSTSTEVWNYGDDDLPCGISTPYTPPQVIDDQIYNSFDHGITTETGAGTKTCSDQFGQPGASGASGSGHWGKGAYMRYIVAGTDLTLNVICSSEAGFIIRANHINSLRSKFLELNSRVRTSGTTPVNFGIDVSDIPTVVEGPSKDATAVKRDHYSFCKRETDKIIGQVRDVPGSAYYCDIDLIEFLDLMVTPVVNEGVSIRTLIGMRKTLQALYSDGFYCACYSYCPCQTHFEFAAEGGKK
jgi:hypothetical protein